MVISQGVTVNAVPMKVRSGQRWTSIELALLCFLILGLCKFFSLQKSIPQFTYSLWTFLSVVLQNKFVSIWKINNPVGKFNKMDPRTDAHIQIGPSNWDYRCQDRRQIQAIGGKYPQVSIIQKWQIAHITCIPTVMSHFPLPHWLVLTYNGVLIITVCKPLLSDFGKHPSLASTILPTYIFLH